MATAKKKTPKKKATKRTSAATLEASLASLAKVTNLRDTHEATLDADLAAHLAKLTLEQKQELLDVLDDEQARANRARKTRK